MHLGPRIAELEARDIDHRVATNGGMGGTAPRGTIVPSGSWTGAVRGDGAGSLRDTGGNTTAGIAWPVIACGLP